MAQFYSGQNGRLVKVDGDTSTTLAKVTNWSFTSSMSPLTTTTLEDTDQTYIAGLRSTTGTCRLYYYDYKDGDDDKNDCGELIKEAVKARTENDVPGVAATSSPFTLELQVIEGSTTKKLKVEILITQAAMAMSVGEVLAADISFQVVGAPEEITL